MRDDGDEEHLEILEGHSRAILIVDVEESVKVKLARTCTILKDNHDKEACQIS